MCKKLRFFVFITRYKNRPMTFWVHFWFLEGRFARHGSTIKTFLLQTWISYGIFFPVNPINLLKSLHPKNGQLALIPGSGWGPISLGIGGPGPSWAGGAQFTPWSLPDRRQGPWDRSTERQRERGVRKLGESPTLVCWCMFVCGNSAGRHLSKSIQWLLPTYMPV